MAPPSGFWRLMRLSRKRGLPADRVRVRALNPNATRCTRAPPPRAPVRASGFYVCSHGLALISIIKLERDDERSTR